MKSKIDPKHNNIIYIFLSLLFVLTIQQFDLFKGNILYLIHAIKGLDENNLEIASLLDMSSPTTTNAIIPITL